MTNAILSANSVEEVVEAINTASAGSGVGYYGGTDLRSAEEMAGEYAWNAAKESGYCTEQDIEGQLEILADNGAKFDQEMALKAAIAFSHDALDTVSEQNNNMPMGMG